MVHTVQIKEYVPRGSGDGDSPGRLTFTLGDKTYHAACFADPELAKGLLDPGNTYPVTLLVHAEGTVEYADPGTPSLEVKQSREEGDKVVVVGRTWEGVDHQVIKLDSDPGVGLRLNLPQTATDYRGGSWLSAEGTLCVDLPPEEHDHE
jgi:hypothetical protein